MSVVPNTRPREASPASAHDIREELATYQAGVDRFAARRTRPTPPPERRKLGPGAEWIELSEAEVEDRRATPYRRAEQPPAPQWIAAGAVLVSNKFFDQPGEPSPGEEAGVPLDVILRNYFEAFRENDTSYRDAIQDLGEANERRADEIRTLKEENAASPISS